MRLTTKVFSKWIQSGYVRILKGVDPYQVDAYYLTHFPVIREDKETTKLRVVMNGKASFGGNPSLNDCILKGPKLLNDLCKVLLRFRKFKIAVSGDIKEMFLQVLLFAEDSKYHRIIYTFPGTNETIIIEAIVHMFGNRGSQQLSYS